MYWMYLSFAFSPETIRYGYIAMYLHEWGKDVVPSLDGWFGEGFLICFEYLENVSDDYAGVTGEDMMNT